MVTRGRFDRSNRGSTQVRENNMNYLNFLNFNTLNAVQYYVHKTFQNATFTFLRAEELF